MKHALAIILFASVLAAQTPPPQPAGPPPSAVAAVPDPAPVKLCKQFDPNAGHEIPLPCPTSRIKRGALKLHHALHVTGEVAIGAVIVAVYIYANAR